MGRKCGVEGCLSESNRPEDAGVTFHKVPSHSDIRPKWITLCRISEDKKSSKVIYICSRHFLRVDFCNFKGKKYMLRQGVLPSVFPWDKSKLEAIKTGDKKLSDDDDKEKLEIKVEPKEEEPVVADVASPMPKQATDASKEPCKEPVQSKGQFKCKEPEREQGSMVEVKIEKDLNDIDFALGSANGLINFAINTKIEALDNNNVWYPARIIEQDYEENEVLIHFEKFSNKFDEWICKDSPRLRPLQTDRAKKYQIEQYTVGERCLATWSDARKFPATVTKVLLNDTYEVLFDDGFVKNLRAHRMCKSSPLFDPIQSSKQERREKKRKINVAQLFGKRGKFDSPDEKHRDTTSGPKLSPSPVDEVVDFFLPQWENGKPIGVESTIETSDGTRKSVIVSDSRLPEGWVKHIAERPAAGRWDVFIVSPDSRKFRSKNEIKNYLEDTKIMKFHPSIFDFSLHKQRTKKKEALNLDVPQFDQTMDNSDVAEPIEEEENKNSLKIPLVDNSYRCPIEGCGKSYRRANLAQMHVKHYHPEYTKFLDSTPNVADLAYARTVGEPFDTKQPGVKTTTPKPHHTKHAHRPPKPHESLDPPTLPPPQPPTPATKDSEIIKLLNASKTPKSADATAHPDFKLRDLLARSEGVPDFGRPAGRDDFARPSGIKTLLPVRAASPPFARLRTNFKRKRFADAFGSPKGNDYFDYGVPQPDADALPQLLCNDTIIEGGRVIKIVRMKQEEIINCTCGYTEEDGLMIQCDLCLCWQHAFCNNIERESQVPEKYVCFICQNPAKARSSLKYFHDQDWLKHGVLATAGFHSRDDELLSRRFEQLKKAHDISGGLIEVKDFVNTLKVKLRIAEAKNHPKLYLWSKQWEKPPLPEKIQKDAEIKPKVEETNSEVVTSMGEEPMEALQASIIPQPEAAIDSADCRLNLLDHIGHSQTLVEERLDEFEKKIGELEDVVDIEDGNDYPRLRQTLNMLLRDLTTLQEFSQRVTVSQ